MRSVAFALALVGFSGVASAHFHLNEPAANQVQATNGDPQKAGPCGGGTSPTNMVTNYEPGGMLTLKLAETINHTGHYRVAIAQTEAMLPAPPTVTGANCGAAAIDANPALPVLKDGLFTTATVEGGEVSTQIPLPAGYECTNCVVQVIEFMSNHAEPCFYYHCAAVTIAANAPDAGMAAMPDAGVDNGSGSGSGGGGGEINGGCSATGNASGLLALLGLVGLRRRRR